MHLGSDGSRLLGVSWCSSAQYCAADHHHQISARFLNTPPYPQTHESARPKRIPLRWTTLRSQHGLNRLLCLGDHRHHRHKKKVGCGVGDGAHAHRKIPEAHCGGACTRICCRGLLGQVTPLPSLTITFDVVRWPHVTWVGMLTSYCDACHLAGSTRLNPSSPQMELARRVAPWF